MEWQPIETLQPNVEVLIAWQWDDGTWCYNIDEVDRHGEWQITNGEATHWSPLLAPPPTPEAAR